MSARSVRRATLVGTLALALWATLALLATAVPAVPPFQLTAMTFAIGGALGLARMAASGTLGATLRAVPARGWAIGIGGLFGYHACYFAALSLAPPVEVTLINYLWPLFVVLLAPAVSGGALSAWHLGGTLLGLGGAVLLVAGPGVVPARAALGGYGLALAAAAIWAGYSALSRGLVGVPNAAVAFYCLGTAVLAALLHLSLEPTVWPDAAGGAAILALGLGPVGAAFYLWDRGVRDGDLRALGGLSYLTPLCSAALLIVFGRSAFVPTVALAGVLIVAGAVLAGRDLWAPSQR